ncbi:MAG: 50S ribosomal protein L1 [Nitrospinota bacterium]|jgi:large subunit ribosomal protein L1|nr:50S ribosomal protein L1 [Nitrospinota bacterium]MDP7386611.1 50S ribosomal protein L1 [Nitrospinota bacterium]HJM43021.1 50S ribosomal protein L1 [Nitrospinota bacterium]
MANPGKRYSAAVGKIDRSKRYELAEALELARSTAGAKFSETVEVAVRLGVDPRKSDQMVRGSVVLPRGLGKSVRVLAFAKGEKEKEARDAGADHVGGEALAARIGEGWLEFESVVATPDMMAVVGKLGKVLGPRGLMPNPKSGSVSFDVARMVRDAKAGKVDFRVDKAGIVHAPLGKTDFDAGALLENAGALLESIQRLRPASAKGAYIRSVSISTTMGPGIKVDHQAVAVAYR